MWHSIWEKCLDLFMDVWFRFAYLTLHKLLLLLPFFHIISFGRGPRQQGCICLVNTFCIWSEIFWQAHHLLSKPSISSPLKERSKDLWKWIIIRLFAMLMAEAWPFHLSQSGTPEMSTHQQSNASCTGPWGVTNGGCFAGPGQGGAVPTLLVETKKSQTKRALFKDCMLCASPAKLPPKRVLCDFVTY